MNRTNNKIIYGSDGQNIHFFYSEKEGICILDENGEKALLKDACSDFDVCRLGSIIYLICQSHDGDIILLKHFDNAWHKYTLLVSKTKESYNKNFYLLITGKCMQLFYTIKSSQRLLLIQQILGDEISQPVVVSSLEDINCPFFAVADANQDTYIYYQSKNGAFGYKIYKWSSKALGEFSAITKEPCSNIYALIDMYNRHHICCLCQEGAMYIQRSLDGKYIKKSYVSCLHSQSDAAPYISLEEEKIYIVWQQKHCVMYSVSNNDGESFCAPVRIISSGEAPSLFSVQNGAKRSFALGGFLENKVRFIRLGTRDTSLMKKNIPLENRQFIKRESRQDEDLIDIGRIKSAISALSKEVSTLKNKLELVMSIIDKKEIQ